MIGIPTMKTRSNKDMFRLAAVLYADNNYEVNSRTIHKKIVESVFLDTSNQYMTVDEILSHIEKNYNLIFTEEEIERLLTDQKNFVTNVRKNEVFIRLTDRRLLLLQEKIGKNSIDHFIRLFTVEKTEYKTFDVKAIIHRFLYEVFTINITSFTKLLDFKKDISEHEVWQVQKFNDVEKGIINSFLSWENDEKNKAIFDISSYALEYCLITNHSSYRHVQLENLRNKIFYLDTNIIFRALGINGESRKNRTITFLKKFNEAKENLLISRFTDLEFKATIKHYIQKIARHQSPNMHSRLFLKYRNQCEFFDYFHQWKIDRKNDNLELFEAHILAQYEQFKRTYNVEQDYMIPFNEKDEKTETSIIELSRDIISFKSKEGNVQAYDNSNWDAKNILLLEKKRGEKNNSLFDTKFFFISSDQGLRKWDYQRGRATPIVLLPSQWMSILLRYVNRTNDDFKSFVSFLNLPQNEASVSNEKLQLVLYGISEITQDASHQSAIIDIMIEQNFKDVVSGNQTDEEVVENSRRKAKSILEEKLSTLEKNHQNLEKQFVNHQAQSGKLLEDLHQQKVGEEKRANQNGEKVQETNQELQQLKRIIQQQHIRQQINKWRLPAYALIPILVFIFWFYALLFFFTDSPFNFIVLITEWIDGFPENSIKRLLLQSLYFLPGGSSIPILQIINKRLISTKAKGEKLEDIRIHLPDYCK